jgi:hypothetical protein
MGWRPQSTVWILSSTSLPSIPPEPLFRAGGGKRWAHRAATSLK